MSGACLLSDTFLETADFIALAGEAGVSVDGILQRFVMLKLPLLCHIIRKLAKKGYEIFTTDNVLVPPSQYGQLLNTESSKTLTIRAPASIYQKALGAMSHEEFQPSDGLKQLSFLAASEERGIMSTDMEGGVEVLRTIDRLAYLGLVRKRIVYPNDGGAARRTNMLHLRRFSPLYDSMAALVVPEHDDGTKSSLVDFIHDTLVDCGIDDIRIYYMRKILNLSALTVKSLRHVCTEKSKIRYYAENGKDLIGINHTYSAMTEPATIAIVSTPLFEQLLPMISNGNSVGLSTAYMASLTGLTRRECLRRMNYLIGAYGLNHCAEQRGRIHKSILITSSVRDTISDGGLISNRYKVDLGDDSIFVPGMEDQASKTDLSHLAPKTLHQKRHEAVLSCISKSELCSFTDCFLSVRALYEKLGLLFNVDRKTVYRVIERLVEAGQVSMHTVTLDQATAYLKAGTKLVVANAEVEDSINWEKLCLSYSDKLIAADVEKKALCPKREGGAVDKSANLAGNQIPALRTVLPDIEQASKSRLNITPKRDLVDRALESRDESGVISFVMGISADGPVWAARILHESTCRLHETLNYTTDGDTAVERDSIPFTLEAVVLGVPFRELVKKYWFPVDFAVRLSRFATGRKLRLEENHVEHCFVQSMKNPRVTLKQFFDILGLKLGDFRDNLLKYYCDKALKSLPLLADLGLVDLGTTGAGEHPSNSTTPSDCLTVRLIIDPELSSKKICTFERCSTVWRHVLAPQLQRYVDERQAVQDALTARVESSRPLVLSRYLRGTEKLAPTDFAKGVYDSELRLRRITELREIHARRTHNFRVVTKRKRSDTRKDDAGAHPRRVRPRLLVGEAVRLGGVAQISNVADSAFNWSWNISEDLFLLELFLMQYLIRASPILPENVRMEILKKHTYVSTTEGLESAPSDILFAMIAKEYHDGLNEYSSATYPVQSLRDKNYEYDQFDEFRLSSGSKSLFPKQSRFKAGNTRLEGLLKKMRNLRRIVAFVLAGKYDGNDTSRKYGEGLKKNLVHVLNDILDPAEFARKRMQCSTALEEVAMSRCLQLLANGNHISGADDTPDSLENGRHSRVIWELCNQRWLRRNTSHSEFSELLENQDFVKTGHFDRSLRWHPSPAYRSLVRCEDTSIRNRKRTAETDEGTGDFSPTTKRCRIQLLSGVDILDPDVLNITASEALGLVQDFARGDFLGTFSVDSSGLNVLPVSDVSFSSSRLQSNDECAGTGEVDDVKSVTALRSHFIAKVLNRVSVTLQKQSVSPSIVEEERASSDISQRIVVDENEGGFRASCGEGCAVSESIALGLISAADINGLCINELLLKFNISEKGGYKCLRCAIKTLVNAASAGRVFFFERTIPASGDKLTANTKCSSYQFWDNLIRGPQGTMHDFFCTTIVVDFKFKTLYYHCSVDVEGNCPWVNSDGSRNIELFGDLASCVFAFLSIKPGSPVSAIHASIPILSSVQTNVLLRLLVSNGVVERKHIPLFGVLDGPFGEVFRSKRDFTTIYFLAG